MSAAIHLHTHKQINKQTNYYTHYNHCYIITIIHMITVTKVKTTFYTMWLKVLTPKDKNGRSCCNLEGNQTPPRKQLSTTVCHYVNVQLWIVFVHQHHLLLALDFLKTPPSLASLSFLMVQSQHAIKSFFQHFLLLHIETEHKQLSKVWIHEDHRSKDWEVGRWTVLSFLTTADYDE